MSTERNPAEYATRNITKITDINDSAWIKGPTFLKEDSVPCEASLNKFEIVNPDREIRPEKHVSALKTEHSDTFSSRFKKFSTWTSFVTAVCFLIHIVHTFQRKTECAGWHICKKSNILPNGLEAAK